MARKKKRGSLIKRGTRFHLQLNIAGTRYKRAIRDPETGVPATTKEQAEAWRDHTVAEIMEKATSNQSGCIPVGELQDAYTQHLPTYTKTKGRKHVDATKESRIAPLTRRKNIQVLNAFVSYLKKHHPAVKTTDDIGPAQATGFMATKSNLKDSSYNRYLFSMRHVCNVVPHFSENPFAGLAARPRSEVEEDTAGKRRFTDEELQVMQQKAAGWIRPAMFIGYFTGLRLGDVVTLRWDCIDGKYLTIRARKTSKEIEIIAPEIQQYLDEWRGRRLLEWNDAVSIRYIAKTLNVSTGTAWKVAEIAGGLPVDPATPKAFAEWIRKACETAAPQLHTEAVKKAAEGMPELDLPPIPDKWNQYVFPKQAMRYLGLGPGTRKSSEAKTNRRPDPSGVIKKFQKFLRHTCGFETCDDSGQTVLGFHSLRVTYATKHRIESGNIERTQKQLQHSNPRVTNGYDRRTTEERRRELAENHVHVPFPGEHAALPPRGSEPEREQLHRLVDEISIDGVRKLLKALEDQ